MSKTNFNLVSDMNTAFGNPRGNPKDIDFIRLRNQCRNILDEFCELMTALGASEATIWNLKTVGQNMQYWPEKDVDIDAVRDALCDIHVFAYGAHHMMGIDADQDMQSVVSGVMTRFVKNEEDLKATLAKHHAKGVTDVYLEGDFPTMIVKSAKDQPDAPKGKFLKSASYREPKFYPIV